MPRTQFAPGEAGAVVYQDKRNGTIEARVSIGRLSRDPQPVAPVQNNHKVRVLSRCGKTREQARERVLAALREYIETQGASAAKRTRAHFGRAPKPVGRATIRLVDIPADAIELLRSARRDGKVWETVVSGEEDVTRLSTGHPLIREADWRRWTLAEDKSTVRVLSDRGFMHKPTAVSDAARLGAFTGRRHRLAVVTHEGGWPIYKAVPAQ